MTAGLTTFLVRRLLTAILFVVVVSSSALVLTRLAPGDAATEIAPGGAAAIHDMRVRLHLDRPIALQLVAWLNGLAHFDLGRSVLSGRPEIGRAHV